MLLHYLVSHDGINKDLLDLLVRSKGSFSVPVVKPEVVKDVEKNPIVVFLDPELQLIIDYKDSLIETDELFDFKPKLYDYVDSRPLITSRHVSKRYCGNLTAFRQDKLIPNVLGSNKTAPKQQNVSETRFTTESKINSRPIISNLNQPIESISDTDNDQNSLLLKRNDSSWTKTPRKGSVDGKQSNKKVKRQGLCSADKRVSRRFANLA